MTFKNKVDWKIQPERCALLIHDMQTHYLEVLETEQRDSLLTNVRGVALACRLRGLPIFASQVPSARQSQERGLMLDMWGIGPKSTAQDIHPALGLGTEHVRSLTKRSYSAFYGNDFEVMLRRLGRDSLLIVGVYTSIGCRCSAIDAFMRDIRPFVVADATADFNSFDHETGLAGMAQTCAQIVDTDAVHTSMEVPRSVRSAESRDFDVC